MLGHYRTGRSGNSMPIYVPRQRGGLDGLYGVLQVDLTLLEAGRVLQDLRILTPREARLLDSKTSTRSQGCRHS